MKLKLEVAEIGLLFACVLMLLVAAFAPAVSQPAHYHDFADQRSWWGVSHAMDVLTNLPFAVWGCVGIVMLWRMPRAALEVAQHRMAALFFAGLVLTATGSGWYHWKPEDAGLALDRLGMVVAFAGLLGLAAAGRISGRAGMALGVSMLLLGPVTVWVWAATGNVLPWAVVQFGGMALVLWLASRAPLSAALPVRWGAVILIYAVAKVLEQSDHRVYELLGQVVSGHSLKHLVASLVGWLIWSALRAVGNSGQNVTQIKTTAVRCAHQPTRV